MPRINAISSRLSETLAIIKKQYEKAIRAGTQSGLIRSGKLIGNLHSFVNAELQNGGFPENWIFEDQELYGYPKKKQQDILVVSPDSRKTGPILSINIRSQLSSISKNFDTMFERVYAEALNLHTRFPLLTLGYVYLIPLLGYDTSDRRIARSEAYDLAHFLTSFTAISNRKSGNDDHWKYEAVCLLLVDFSKNPPKTIEELNDIKRIDKKISIMFNENILSINNFFSTILETTMTRNFDYLLRKNISLG